MALPPSTGNTTPVMYLACDEARKSAALATSDGSPNLPIGVRARTLAFLSGSPLRAFDDIGVAMKPGAMQFTRTPDGDHSTARARVIPSIADLDAVYATTSGIPYCDAIELIMMMLPAPRTTIDFATSRVSANTEVWFVRTMSSYS